MRAEYVVAVVAAHLQATCRQTMKQTVIFHTDLPCGLRHSPYDRRHAHKLTKIIWQQAAAIGINPPFGLDRMSDRLVVRELKKVTT